MADCGSGRVERIRWRQTGCTAKLSKLAGGGCLQRKKKEGKEGERRREVAADWWVPPVSDTSETKGLVGWLVRAVEGSVVFGVV
jgi:hypothetical protein